MPKRARQRMQQPTMRPGSATQMTAPGGPPSLRGTPEQPLSPSWRMRYGPPPLRPPHLQHSNCNISLHLLVCGSPYVKGPQVFGWFFSLCCHPSSLVKARHVSERHHFGKWPVFSHAMCLYASSGDSTKNFFRLQAKTWSAKPGKIS